MINGVPVFPDQQEEWYAIGPGTIPPAGQQDIITVAGNPAYGGCCYIAMGVIGAANATGFDGSAVAVNDPTSVNQGPMTISTTHPNTMIFGCGRTGQLTNTPGPNMMTPFTNQWMMFEYAALSATQSNFSVDVTP